MKTFLLIFIGFAGFTSAFSEEILPMQAPLTRYTEEWEKSPFNRIVVRVVETKVMSAFAKNLVLEGLVSHDTNGLTAYVRDRTDGSFSIINEKATDTQPLRIIDHTKLDDPRETSIKISNGSEEAVISYEQDAMTRTIEQAAPAKPNEKDTSAEPVPEKQPEAEPPKDKPRPPGSANKPDEPPATKPDEVKPETDRKKSKNGPPSLRRKVLLPGQ